MTKLRRTNKSDYRVAGRFKKLKLERRAILIMEKTD
jgi:hypothetical protein